METKDIFISYKDDGEGRNFTARLYEKLSGLGFSVYYNVEDHHSGSFPESLRTSVESCHDFILVLTQSCLDQLIRHEKIDWVRKELLIAKNCGKNIIPLLMPGVIMPKDKEDMPEELQFLPDLNAVKVHEPYDKSSLELVLGWMTSEPVSKSAFETVFQSNRSYDVDQDFADTLRLAESGDIKAMYEIANMYYYGFTDGEGNVSVNYIKAYEWFKKVSEGEDTYYKCKSRSMLGEMFYKGIVPSEAQSFQESLRYHQDASDFSVYSLQKSAFMLSEGIGCQFDYDAAEKFYLDAINRGGDNPAISGLALLYIRYGEFEKAESLYKGIVDSYPLAAYELGCLYSKGLLSKDKRPDGFKAAFYFQHAINKGNRVVESRYQLGLLYFRGTSGFINDYKVALENFQIAADSGHVWAAYMLGYMYEYGFVKKDLEKAIRYYTFAADRGHTLCPTQLATLYQIPEHQNYEKALKYAKLAADYGEVEGTFIYGNLLFFGRGCEANPEKAYKIYKQALDHGYEQAAFMIERIEKNK